MDFAIIETGGKQYKITPQSSIEVEKLEGEVGSSIVLDKVLMIVDGENIQIGTPYIKDATFEATVESQHKGKKINILRFKAKSRYRRRQGHRQSLTSVTLVSKPKEKPTTKSEAKKSEPAKAETAKKTQEKTVKKAAKPVAKKATSTKKTEIKKK